MEKWAGKTAFVAGGNSGMGAALVRRFLEHKMKVYSMDKNVDFLNDLKSDEEHGPNLTVLQADVTKQEEVLQCMRQLEENTEEINIVIHSIGIVGNSNLIDGEVSEWQNLINVNMIGFCCYMKEVVNLMLKQNVKDGRIIILNSVVVIDPAVFGELHFYAATKCALDALAQGLQYELEERNSSIKVSNVYAGLVKTDMYKNSLGPNFETPFYKTFVSLSVDDIGDTVEYLLSSPSNVLISRMVVCPRGVFKQNFFAV